MNEEIINIHLDQVYFQFMISGHIHVCFFPLFVLSYIYLNRILHKLYLFGLIYIKQGF